MEQKSILNYKTLNKLSELSLVSSTLATTTGLYQSVREKNFVTRNSLNLAEFSVQMFTNVVLLPLATHFEEPISKVDEYLSSKVETAATTTKQLATNLKAVYTTQMDRYNQAKEYIIATYNKLVVAVTMLLSYLNIFLEKPLVKKISEPVLNLVETGLTRVLAIETKNLGQNATTLNRVYMLNQKVYNKIDQQLRNVLFQKADLKLN